MNDIFVGKQAIFTTEKEIFAYELLFRGNPYQNFYKAPNGDRATARLLENSLLEFDLAKLTKKRPAFINFSAELLMKDFIEVLPKEFIVIEILETAQPTERFVKRCQKLKHMGFKLALDDFVFSPQYESLIALADYIKIDFRATARAERYNIRNKYRDSDIVFLAEKVETHEEYQEAVAFGYELIQGYFFAKPEIVAGKTAKVSAQVLVSFLVELTKKKFEYSVVENLLRHDVSLSYKLLRLINSPYFGLRKRITSLKQALSLIGQEDLCKWASLLLLSSLTQRKSPQLMLRALTRARFLELSSQRLGARNSRAFFLGGMFSLMDIFLECPMVDIVHNLPFLEEIKAGMLGYPNKMGMLLEVVMAYEQTEWKRAEVFALVLGLKQNEIIEDYYQSMLWSSHYQESVEL